MACSMRSSGPAAPANTAACTQHVSTVHISSSAAHPLLLLIELVITVMAQLSLAQRRSSLAVEVHTKAPPGSARALLLLTQLHLRLRLHALGVRGAPAASLAG